MLAIMATLQGLRNLDNWPESEAKSEFLLLRKALSMRSNCYEGLPKDIANRLKDRISYSDPFGNPITLFEWAVISESINRHIGEDHIKIDSHTEPIRISTVWLGLNHSFFNGKVIIFETMIFGIEDDEDMSGYQDRYSTIEEAERGHERAVNMVRNYLERRLEK